MRLRRTVLLSLCASLTFLSCGKSKTFDVKRPITQEPISVRSQVVNVTAVADGAVQTRRNEQVMFLVAASHNDQPDPPRLELRSDTPSHQKSQVSVAATNFLWDCIAEAETGSDYAMHGSTYSTAFGVVNDIVEDYGTPEEQAQIFSGTASKETQIAVVSRFSNEHGFGGWGELTKQKCGL